MKVRVAYFSAAGGTTNAAYILAHMFSENPEMIDQTPLKSREKEICFDKNDLAIFAAPSYGGKIPHAPNLFTNLSGNNTPCIIAATYGNRACENNLAQMKKIADDNGFRVIGAISIIIPHIFGVLSGKGRPDIKDRKVIYEFSQKIKNKLSNEDFHELTIEGNPEITDKPHMSKPIVKLTDDGKCQHCGTCVRECPTGAIDSKTFEINSDLCIDCQHCSFVCPSNARSYEASWYAMDSKCNAKRNKVEYIL